VHGSRFNEDGEEMLRPWTKVELPTFKGNDPLGWMS